MNHSLVVDVDQPLGDVPQLGELLVINEIEAKPGEC